MGRRFLFDLVMVLLIPGIMILAGLLFRYRPPRDINNVFGYRTAMSRKNQATWRFAHRCAGKIYVCLGLILVPLSVASLLRVSGQDSGTMGAVVIMTELLQCAALFVPIIPTEIALRKAFDKDGRRKEK